MLKNEAYGETCSSARHARASDGLGCDRTEAAPSNRARVRSLNTAEDPDRSVPAAVNEELFDAVQDACWRTRSEDRRAARGAAHLLQGLVVCKRCGYAYCGQSMTHLRKDWRSYQYYFCTGSMFSRCDRKQVCWNKSVRMELL